MNSKSRKRAESILKYMADSCSPGGRWIVINGLDDIYPPFDKDGQSFLYDLGHEMFPSDTKIATVIRTLSYLLQRLVDLKILTKRKMGNQREYIGDCAYQNVYFFREYKDVEYVRESEAFARKLLDFLDF